jgi:hypothetical protein
MPSSRTVKRSSLRVFRGSHSSVGIAARLWTEIPRNRSSVSGRSKKFLSSRQRPDGL